MMLVSVALLPPLAFGADRAENTSPAEQKSIAPTGEVFTGGTLTKNTWMSWAGGVKSLSFSLYDEGWRIRALGAYGQYGFTTQGQPNTANPALFEITPGYQFITGPFISKIYMGLHGEHHQLSRPDANNKAKGMGYGFKVISENWINLPMHSFVSLDGSYSTLNSSYQGAFRSGMAHFMPRLSLGPEFQIVGNDEYYQLRLGGFARWKTKTGALEASAGYAKDQDEVHTPYFSLSWLKRF